MGVATGHGGLNTVGDIPGGDAPFGFRGVIACVYSRIGFGG